jgi:hypothetical protein
MVHGMSIGRPWPTGKQSGRPTAVSLFGWKGRCSAPACDHRPRRAQGGSRPEAPRGPRSGGLDAAEPRGTCLAAHPPELWYSSRLWEGAYG